MCNSSNVGQEARGGQDNRRAAGSWQQHWETEREHQPRAALPTGTTPTPAAQHQPAPPPFPIPASLAHCGTGSFQRLSKEKGTKVLNGVTDMSAGVRKGLSNRSLHLPDAEPASQGAVPAVMPSPVGGTMWVGGPLLCHGTDSSHRAGYYLLSHLQSSHQDTATSV